MTEAPDDGRARGVATDFGERPDRPEQLRRRIGALRALASDVMAQSERGQAEGLYLQALDLAEKSLESDDPELGSILRGLAMLYQGSGRVDDAVPLLRRALAGSEAAWGPASYEVAFDCCQLAAALVARGDGAEATDLYERALEVKRCALDPRHPALTTTLHNLAVLRDAEGRVEEARSLWAEARAALEPRPEGKKGR